MTKGVDESHLRMVWDHVTMPIAQLGDLGSDNFSQRLYYYNLWPHLMPTKKEYKTWWSNKNCAQSNVFPPPPNAIHLICQQNILYKQLLQPISYL